MPDALAAFFLVDGGGGFIACDPGEDIGAEDVGLACPVAVPGVVVAEEGPADFVVELEGG